MTPSTARFQRLERLAPLGYFAMGVGWLKCGAGTRMLAIANGSDWTPQPLTLHASHPDRGFEKLPCWFSDDYDHHMGLAIGDLNGNGYDDVVVAVFSGKNQHLNEGGVKVYLGGPSGLCTTPVWLAQGFAATGVAIASFDGKKPPDIVVSCLSEGGTIQAPALDDSGRLPGRPRLLLNRTQPTDANLRFEERVIQHDIARGAGDVAVADIDLDGTLDVVFASSRTAVLFGNPGTDCVPWANADTWISKEEHPFSFSVQPLMHPDFPGSQLVATSRGLLSGSQLKGRRLDEIGAGILIHAPMRNGAGDCLQHLAPVDPARPELPAGLAVAHDGGGRPHLIAGFLDARSRDVRGAPLRTYRSAPTGSRIPFDQVNDQELPGGGLMAGRVCVAPRAEGPTTISEYSVEISQGARHVITLPRSPAGEPLFIEATGNDGEPLQLDFTQSADGTTLSFFPALQPGTQLRIALRTADELDIVAASSAAWPPAGASGIWRGRLARRAVQPINNSPSSAKVQKAG